MIKVSNKKPLIGVIPDYVKGEKGSYSTRDFYALRANYIEMVNKAGGASLMLPYDYDLIDDYINSLDGLVVVGGYFDINPARYNEKEIHKTVKLNEIRENFEHEFISRALNIKTSKKNGLKIPFLGICNGMQLLNVLHGGSAIQHIPDENGNYMNHEQSHNDQFNDYAIPYHDVIIKEGTHLAKIIENEKIKTNSSHHQAIRNTGKGLQISANASDGIIEAIEDPNHNFCIGIQWHPEFDISNADRKIFEKFIAAAIDYKNSKND